MGNNKIDGDERDDIFDLSFDDELEGAFDALEVQGSGVKKIDPSLRMTMPDIDGVILEKAAELARTAHVDNAKDLDENKGATGNNHSLKNLSEMRLDDAYRAAGRGISLMEEAGVDTDFIIDRVDEFVGSREVHLSHGQICEIRNRFSRI